MFRKTDLPCTWDTPIVFFRKQFRPVFAKEGKRFFLHVSRLALEADFYLNGSLVYRHGVQEAYAPFELEITDKLKRDGENTLLICARGRMAGSIQENLRKKSFNPEAEMRAMNHLMPGFSEIYLESTPEFSLNMPQIITDFTGKRISVKADLPKGFRLENRVFHREREVVPAFGESVRWENPILWGPDSASPSGKHGVCAGRDGGGCSEHPFRIPGDPGGGDESPVERESGSFSRTGVSVDLVPFVHASGSTG